MKVAILGAAGAIGKSTAAALAARGDAVRVVGRSAAKLDGFGAAERVAADVATADGCARALAGMDAAVYTLGLPYTKADFARYPAMMTTCLEAARKAGLKELVLITNVYPYGLPQAPLVAETHPREPVSVKGEYRKQQEDLLLAADGTGGLRTLSLRLPNFYGPDARLSIADGIFAAAVRGKTANLLGPITTPQELVFTPDVGPVVAALLARPEAFGQAWNFAGPGHLTMKEFAERIYAAAGQPKARMRVAGPTMLALASPFSSLMRELREMMYLQAKPILLDDTKLRALLPGLVKTPYDEGIRRSVQAYAAEARAAAGGAGAAA
ncbi:MAG: NAD(P)H-binding protein [Myxococcota bacterium]